MDGNDLGLMFRPATEEDQQDGPDARQRKLAALAHSMENAVNAAFAEALDAVVKEDVKKNAPLAGGSYTVPLRPLVLGGDDVTVITRAEAALPFVRAFSAAFERESEQHGHRCSMGAGMVIMPSGYPFAKAWTLCEDLCKKAKNKTCDRAMRPSSLDWLVLTSDVEASVSALRVRTARADGGKALTCKPFILDDTFDSFLENGKKALDHLPRSHVREAAELCRGGEAAAAPAYAKLRENIKRGLGGRHDARLLSLEEFDAILPGGFFCRDEGNACPLGDWLELAHLGIGAPHA
jgi:hypothetical protein